MYETHSSRIHHEYVYELSLTAPDMAFVENTGDGDCVIKTILFMIGVAATEMNIQLMRMLLEALLEKNAMYT